MNSTTEIKKNQPEQILSALNPKSAHFNFEIWAEEVRQQMLIALQQRLNTRKKVSVE